MKFNTILFDLDGTLIDSRADLTAAVNAALKEVSKPPLNVDQVVPHVGHGLTHLLQNTVCPTDDKMRRLATQAFKRYYWDHCTDKTTLYEGVFEGVKRLYQKAKVAVVTNKPKNFSDKILNSFRLEPYLHLVVGGDSYKEKKPDPAPVLKAMQALKGEGPSTLMVGDGIQDIEAGKRAGIKTCAVTYGFGYKKNDIRALKPNFEIDHFNDLKEIL